MRAAPQPRTLGGSHAHLRPLLARFAPGHTPARIEVEAAADPHFLDGISGLHFHTLCEQNADALARTLEAVERAFGRWLPGLKWLNFGGGHHIHPAGLRRGHFYAVASLAPATPTACRFTWSPARPWPFPTRGNVAGRRGAAIVVAGRRHCPWPCWTPRPPAPHARRAGGRCPTGRRSLPSRGRDRARRGRRRAGLDLPPGGQVLPGRAT